MTWWRLARKERHGGKRRTEKNTEGRDGRRLENGNKDGQNHNQNDGAYLR